MQPISTFDSQVGQGGGGRVASPSYRHSLKLCEDFAGLEEDTNRYELLMLVKRAGKAAGFTPRMIELLDYYLITYTQDQDWEKGSRPIVYQSLARTALALGVSERQIQKIEQRLFDVGAITWHSSGNYKRYGSRDPETGRIVFAYGVDLTPLAFLRTDLQIKLYEKQRRDQDWIAIRREISWTRGQIRSLLREIREEGTDPSLIQSLESDYQRIAVQLRTHIDLPKMQELLERHKRLHSRLLGFVEVDSPQEAQPAQASTVAEKTANGSPTSEQKFAHYKYSNPTEKKNCSPPDPALQESVAEPSSLPDKPSERDLRHISLEQLLLVASDRFRARMPVETRSINWSEFVEAAYQLRTDLFVSQRSWADACQTLGRNGAAICVLLTDRGRDRIENPVLRPAAYFRGMVNRAKTGELRLGGSIFGLLDRDNG